MKKSLPSIAIAIATLIGAILILPHQLSAVALAPDPVISAATPQYVEGEVLVKFKPSASLPERHATIASHQNALLAELPPQGWTHVMLATGQRMAETLTAYRSNPDVEYAQPNYIYHATAVPNDPQYRQLWALKNSGQTVTSFLQPGNPMYPYNNPGTSGDDINIEKGWDHITDCSSVVVAVIDSGVNYEQEDLANNMWNGGSAFPFHGYNFVDKDNNPMDLDGHGTHVAGIIGAAGNNAIGTTGVCWKASIMAVRVLDTKNPSNPATSANVLQGVNFAVNHGAKVINMSLGGENFDQAFSDSITIAQNADVVVVVAAGNKEPNNDNDKTPIYPCNFRHPNLICVAALDQSYRLATFSNYGIISVDVGAPGTNILSGWAGANSRITDSFTLGWITTKTTGDGWDSSVLSGKAVLHDPTNWPSGTYALNTVDRAYKSFNLSSVDVATLKTSSSVNVTPDGTFAVAMRAAGGDPFSTTNPTYLWGPYYTDKVPASSESKWAISADISNCLSSNCTIGFQLKTGATADLGAAIYDFAINALTLNTTSYNTLMGTSMASPVVAGLATMLRAHNPQYTYADVINAIEKAGRTTPSLMGKTTTGKAIDVMSSLAFLNTPKGLTATVTRIE